MRSIVVTRPQGQAQPLCEQLKSLGNQVFHIPLLSIQPLVKPIPSVLADWIFISPNAVTYTRENASDSEWQQIISQPNYAIGVATRDRLVKLGAKQVTHPKISQSEALLELGPLQAPIERRIIIACGIGGRQFLELELAARGAQVERYECYQRQNIDPQDFRQFFEHQKIPNTALWIVTSEQALTLLAGLVNHPVDCMVSSKRLYDIAAELTNINLVTVSRSAQSHDLVRCIEQLNNKAIK